LVCHHGEEIDTSFFLGTAIVRHTSILHSFCFGASETHPCYYIVSTSSLNHTSPILLHSIYHFPNLRWKI
jgi:hypothetical protein